ncbi:MAG: hypothetical protein CME65_05780 [Halobacteriovoraceae bacterium]|nr:hypothetical protein [Halobacteriovoraceae bacterium]
MLTNNKKNRLLKKIFLLDKRSAYFFDKESFETKLRDIKQARPSNVFFLFPVKSFPYPDALEIAAKHLDGFDISNQNELDLILPYLNSSKLIWNSSPYETDLESCKAIIQDGKESQRINFNNSRNEKSRFGLDINSITLRSNIHVHLGFQNNCANDYENMAKEIKKIIEAQSAPVERINLGGGFEFESLESLLDCLMIVSEILKDYKVFFEPGNWLSQGSVGMIGTVLESTKLEDETRLVVSISKLAHLKWSQKIKLSSVKKNENKFKKISIYGPTCSEDDIIGILENQDFATNRGDLILLENISSYSFAWRNDFNGIEKPPIITI